MEEGLFHDRIRGTLPTWRGKDLKVSLGEVASSQEHHFLEDVLGVFVEEAGRGVRSPWFSWHTVAGFQSQEARAAEEEMFGMPRGVAHTCVGGLDQCGEARPLTGS